MATGITAARAASPRGGDVTNGAEPGAANGASYPAETDRQPRRDRTRIAMVRAGQKLFSERPSEIVSVDDIVQAADVAKGTFYNHFADKDEFEREIFREARRELELAITSAFGDAVDPAARMAIGMCVAVRFAHDNPSASRLIVRQGASATHLDSEVNDSLLRDISAGILSGRFMVPTTEIGGLVILGLGNVAVVRALELDDILARVTLGQQLACVMLRALGLDAEESSLIAAQSAERVIRAPAAPRPQVDEPSNGRTADGAAAPREVVGRQPRRKK